MSDDGHGPPLLEDLTEAVATARRGLRRDVQRLLDGLPTGQLLAPLARAIPNAREGDLVELEDDMTLSPHVLVAEDGSVFSALFTQDAFLAPFSEKLNWTTDGAELQYASFPARIALDMVLRAMDDEAITGLVLNAGHSSELILRRDEVGALVRGRAIPLVGYVENIPEQPGEQTLISESPDPPDPQFAAAVERALDGLSDVEGFELLRTFNVERDLEPHWTVRVTTKGESPDQGAIVAEVLEAAGPLVPPPGYLDVLFDGE